MKKFAIAAATATATALTLTLANAAFAAQSTSQAPMVVAAGEGSDAKAEATDSWITTKVKANLMTEAGVPGTAIKVETNQGVVSLSSTTPVTTAQKETAVTIAWNTKGVKDVSAAGLKTE